MPADVIQNRQTAVLALPVGLADTTITLASPLAPTGQFRILVDSEIMLVTAGFGGTVLTVTRGAEGPAPFNVPATHAAGDTVAVVLTAGGLSNQFMDLWTAQTKANTLTVPLRDRGGAVYNLNAAAGVDPTGVTPSGAAINTFLASLPSTGCTVQCFGIYLVDVPLTPKSRTRFMGEGFFDYSNAGAPGGTTKFVATGGIASVFDLRGTFGVSMQGVTIDGGITGGGAQGLVNLCQSASAAVAAKFLFCRFSRSAGPGVNADGSAVSNIHSFVGCHFDTSTYGLAGTGFSDSWIQGCYFYANTVTGLYLAAGSAAVQIGQCKFEYNRDKGLHLYQAADINVTSCVADRNTNEGFLFSSAIRCQGQALSAMRNGTGGNGTAATNSANYSMLNCTSSRFEGILSKVGSGADLGPYQAYYAAGNTNCTIDSVGGDAGTGATLIQTGNTPPIALSLAHLDQAETFTGIKTFNAGLASKALIDLSGEGGLTDAANSSPGAPGTGLGDKLNLWGDGTSEYGLGIQSGRVVLYVPSGASVAVRQMAASGQRSSGADAVVLGADGRVTATGALATGQSASAPALATGGTITTANVGVARVAPTAAVTGVILQAGTVAGQQVVVINESAAANTITFAAAPGGNVADGASSPIAGLTSRVLVWDGATSLWYRGA